MECLCRSLPVGRSAAKATTRHAADSSFKITKKGKKKMHRRLTLLLFHSVAFLHRERKEKDTAQQLAPNYTKRGDTRRRGYVVCDYITQKRRMNLKGKEARRAIGILFYSSSSVPRPTRSLHVVSCRAIVFFFFLFVTSRGGDGLFTSSHILLLILLLLIFPPEVEPPRRNCSNESEPR